MEQKIQERFFKNHSPQELIERYGHPIYLYHAETIEEKINAFKEAFGDLNLRIKYAAKALTNLTILKLMKKYGVEIDAVSLNEVKMAIQVGHPAEHILFTPNCVAFEEIQEAVELGVQINIDGLDILKDFGRLYGKTKKCCIRINPHLMAGGNLKISTGHIDSKFGISVHQIDEILAIAKQYEIPINGIHVHTGSDILESEIFLKGAQIIFKVAAQFENLEFIDFGSGFKVPYSDKDQETNIAHLGKSLGEQFKVFCKKYGRDLEVWFEPGKFLVSESGLLLVKTNQVKKTPTNTFVGVNSGLNHLLRPMMYDSYHHIVNLSNPSGEKHIYNVVGYICETDTLGFNRRLPEVKTGDILGILNAGAYGFSMASNYNSRPRPAEVLLYQDRDHLIRRRETYEDLLRNQVDISI